MDITSSATRSVTRNMSGLPCWAFMISRAIYPFIPTRSFKIILEVFSSGSPALRSVADWQHAYGDFGDLTGAKPTTRRDETFSLQIIFLVGTILGPLIVLTADISKSAVVGGIVGVPAALLVVAVAAASASDPSAGEPFWVRRLWAACAVAAFTFGLYNQLDQPGGIGLILIAKILNDWMNSTKRWSIWPVKTAGFVPEFPTT